MHLGRLLVCVGVLLAGSVASRAGEATTAKEGAPWRGVHVMLNDDRGAGALMGELPELAKLGVNTLVVEVNYSFEYQSHPELRAGGFVTRKQAGALAEACRKNGIRLIPQFNCLGHQSWAANTLPLLVKYPQLDETPGQFPQNKGIYCRSWCPRHPEVNPIVFALMDELIDAFKADALHVGMDEVFLIGSEHCARCKGRDPGDLFALAVNDYHKHLVENRKVEMLMWSDRLLDAKTTGYGKWEAAENGTQSAIDRIPRDIVMCDWHYGKRETYPSIPLLMEKGFRVWPAGWDKVDATEALVDYARKHRGERMLGHLCTIWGKVRPGDLAEYGPVKTAMEKWRE